MEVVVASNNLHKISEIKAMLNGFFSDFYTMRDLGINIDIEETGTTFYENARIKAKTIAEMTGKIALGDDSGLMVDALDGAPGVYSARYAGDAHSDKDNVELLLKNMQNTQNRRAKFVTCLVLYYPDGREIVAVGESLGYITDTPKGDNGFGYDPVFFSDALGKRYAEATAEEKNSVSHRGMALKKLKEKLGKFV